MKQLLVIALLCSCSEDYLPKGAPDGDPVIVENVALPADLPPLYREFYEENGGLNYATVAGARMAYVDNRVADKPTVVLLHGLPDNNFLYRDVIREIGNRFRVIAPDHIGYGLSDRPEVTYSFSTLSQYLEGFIKALDLKNVHLVVTDVGGPAGLGVAARNPALIQTITMYETLWLPVDDLANSNYAEPFQEFLLNVREPGLGEEIVIENNQILAFLDQLTVTDMRPEVFEVYRYPWQTKEARRVMLENTRSIPVAGQPADSKKLFDNFVEYLSASTIPKLVIEAQPGAISPSFYVDQAVELFPNTSREVINGAGHFVTEDKPREFTDVLVGFIEREDQ